MGGRLSNHSFRLHQSTVLSGSVRTNNFKMEQTDQVLARYNLLRQKQWQCQLCKSREFTYAASCFDNFFPVISATVANNTCAHVFSLLCVFCNGVSGGGSGRAECCARNCVVRDSHKCA